MSDPTTPRSNTAPAGDVGRAPPRTPDTLASAHARFARAALAIYIATAAVAFALLLVALVTDMGNEEDQTRKRLALETDVLAHSLGQRLGLLGDELRRLSERAEVDLGDQDLAPEKSLLRLSHERSAFFNVGVAILDRRGEITLSEPPDFLAHGVSFARERWFGSVQKGPASRIVPVQPDRADSVLYVVSPLNKGGNFTGALLGAVDLARGQALAPENASSRSIRVVATTDGEVVYPPSRRCSRRSRRGAGSSRGSRASRSRRPSSSRASPPSWPHRPSPGASSCGCPSATRATCSARPDRACARGSSPAWAWPSRRLCSSSCSCGARSRSSARARRRRCGRSACASSARPPTRSRTR